MAIKNGKRVMTVFQIKQPGACESFCTCVFIQCLLQCVVSLSRKSIWTCMAHMLGLEIVEHVLWAAFHFVFGRQKTNNLHRLNWSGSLRYASTNEL